MNIIHLKTRMKMRYILTFSLCFQLGYAGAETPSAVFQAASNDYKKGDFAAAAQKYEAILKDGKVSPELYYNLGNAYFKQNQLGKCILNYERAKRYARTEDLDYNLALARERVKDEPEQIPAFFLQSGWENFRCMASLSTWTISSIAGMWLGVMGLCLWLLGKARTHKKRGFIAGLSLLALSLLSFLAARGHYNILQNHEEGIVMTETAQVRSSPDELGATTETLGEGVKVKILDQIGSWYKIRLSNGAEGWLTLNQIEKI